MDKKIIGFKENLATIRPFRSTFAALADESVLRLLTGLDSDGLDNDTVRMVLGVSRKRAWLLLVKLVELGIVQRRGHHYTVSSTTFEMAHAFSLALHGLVGGTQIADSGLSGLMTTMGHDFIEWAYTKGKIDRTQYLEYEKQLKESRTEGPTVGR